ncbi:hypothetical protein ACVWXL_009265 [Bradyrhizobium sp. GM22.5]
MDFGMSSTLNAAFRLRRSTFADDCRGRSPNLVESVFGETRA